MKKIKLFLAAIAAMVGMGVQAQSWTASEVGEGYFMLYNVGTGQYLTRGNGWGTQASITTTGTTGNGIALRLAGSGSDFKMFTGINGDAKGLENLDGGTIYTDQANNKNSTWTFTQVATDNGPVYTIVSKDNHAGGAGAYLTASAENTIVTPGTDGTIAGAQWKLMAIPAQPIGMDDASETNPVDATSLIVNPNFSFDAIKKGDGWTMQSSNYNPCGGNVSGTNVVYNPCAESWRAAFTLSQTLTVKNGIYEVTAQAAVTEYDVTGADLPVVYANDVTTTFDPMTKGEDSMAGVATNFTAGNYTVGPIRVVVTNGSLTIGVRGTRTNTWCVWDNFKLTYKGVDLSALKEALQAQIDAVPALQGTTTTAAYNAAKNYADGINVASLNTEEAISTASTELSALVDAAKALQSAYAGYLVIRNAVDALDDDATIYTGDANIDLSTIDENVNATTTLEALNEAIETAKPQLQASAAEFISSVTLNEGKRFDITKIYLTNPDFEVPTASGQMPPGWNITITGQNLGQQNRTDTNPETGLAITNFIEAWHPSQLGNGVIAQTVSSLPEGTYVLECDASICHDPAGADDITGANLFVQSSLKKEVSDPISNVRLYIKHYDVTFSHGGSGSVTFGLEANNTNANWLSADNFKVYYAGGVDLSVYVEALAEAVAAFEALEASADPADYATYKAIVDENNKVWGSSAEYQAAIDAVNGATSGLSALIAFNEAVAAANEAKAANPNVTGNELTALNEAIAATPTTTDEYTAAIEALTAATTAFTAAAPAYNAFAAAKAETAKLFGDEVANSVTAPTNADAAPAATKALNVAQYNKVVSDYPYSLTSKIGEFNTWTGTATSGGDPDTPQTLSSEHWSAATHTYYEQGKNGWASTSFSVTYTKTTTLPAGDYVIKVAARASANVNGTISATATENTVALPNFGAASKGITTEGVASFNEGTFAKDGVGYGWEWRFLPFTLASEGEVTITINAESTSQYGWVSIADGELLSAQNIATAVTYADNETNSIEDIEVANVTITRSVKAGLNTIVLPFDLTEAQVQKAFGTGAVVYSFEDAATGSNSQINFNKVDAGTISANVPVLVKAVTASDSQVFEGVQVVAPTGDVKVAGTNFDFVGNYAPLTVAAKDYFVSGGKLYKSTGATNLKAFRAYVKNLNPESEGEVKLFIEGEDGIVTAIDAIDGESVVNGVIFNLAGQRVQKAQKGVYIINGKKVAVK